MDSLKALVIQACFFAAVSVFVPAAVMGQVSVLTSQGDIGRTGANLQEPYLTPQSISSGNFQKLISDPVNGNISTQPLYVPNVQIGGTSYNVLVVATSKDDVYAFDADRGSQLWHITLLDALHGAGPDAGNPLPAVCVATMGVLGTPTIDAASGTIYLVGRTWESNYSVQRVHALDITTGLEKFGSPTTIQASVAGSGFNSSAGQLNFDPGTTNNRAGLLLLNGIVYVSFGANCEPHLTGWHGWLMGYDATTLQQTGAWSTTPDGTGSGIWMSGAGLAADVPDPLLSPYGRLFAAIGNGSFNAVPPYTTSRNFADDIVRLDLTNGIPQPQDSFTPSNQLSLNAADLDLGSGGVLTLPDSAGSLLHPHLLVQASKSGVIYLVDRDNMGGYNGSNAIVQELDSSLSSYGMFATPVYWNGNLYFWASNDYLKAFTVSGASISTAPTSMSNAIAPPLGATLSISASGPAAGVVWALSGSGGSQASLQAFDATNLANMLYSSGANLSRDNAGLRTKFSIPTIANGKVYVGSNNQVNMFGSMFDVGVTSSVVQAQAGSTGTSVISVSSSAGSSFAGSVSLTITGLPNGVSASLPAASVTLGQAPASGLSVLTLSVANSVPNGSYPFQVTGSSNGLQSVTTLTLIVGPGPSVTFSQNIVAFSQALGITSAPSQLTLTNSGNTDLTISGFVISGLNATDFRQTSNCIGVLATGVSCTLSITFTPHLTLESATLTVNDSAFGVSSTQTVALSGNALAPLASVTAAVGFGSQTVNLTSPALAITLSNTGASALAIYGISIGGVDSADFAITATACGASLAAASSCTISVAFRPSGTRVESAVLTVSDNSGNVTGAAQTIALSGTGGLPAVTLSTAALSFPAQVDGVRSVAQSVVVKNTGTTALLLTSNAISGPNAADFISSVASSCGTSIAPAKSCTFWITFTPVVAGSESAVWTLTDNGGGIVGSTQTVALAGTGVAAPAASLTPAVNFGAQTVGGPSTVLAIPLRNTGNAPLAISGVSIGGTNSSDFTITGATTCANSLMPATSCVISVSFRPSITGPESAVLTVSDNSRNVTGAAQNSALNGTGGLPAVTLSTPALTFAAQTDGVRSAAQTVIVSNTGTSNLLITSYAISGLNAADFASSSCGNSIAPGKSCTMSVTFNPTKAGVESAVWTLMDNTGGIASSQQTVALSGTGLAAASASITTALPFGVQTVGWLSPAFAVTLRNTGTIGLSITGISLSGTNNSDFAITSATTCGASLAPAASCLIFVTFKPSLIGAESAILTLSDNSGNVAGATQNVALSGTGGLPAATLSTAALNFPAQTDGVRSAVQNILVSNGGTSNLLISSYAISGPNSTDFATSSCGGSIAPGKSCSISITFNPVTAGNESAVWTLTGNSGGVAGAQQTVVLNGSGLAAPVASLVAALPFGVQTIGWRSSAWTTPLRNIGSGTLLISGISLTGMNGSDFTIRGTTCGAFLAPAASCTVSVTFQPSLMSLESAFLMISDNSGNVSGAAQNVALSGSGGLPAATLSTAVLSFPVQTVGIRSPPQTVTLSNTGTSLLLITGYSISGPNAADFAASSCGSSLAAGKSCTVSITFNPASVNAESAVWSVTGNSGGIAGTIQTVTLSGTGVVQASALH